MPSANRLRVQMSDAEVTEFLNGQMTVYVATKGPGPRLHLVPLFYAFIEGHIMVTGYGRSQKVLNLERDNTLTALVETGDRYDQLVGVQLGGAGEIIGDTQVVMEVMSQIRQRRAAARHAIETKEHGIPSKRVAVRIVPSFVHSWDHRKLKPVDED